MTFAAERIRRDTPVAAVPDPANNRLARCYERVLAGLPGESPVTVVEMLLIAKRIREGDHDGRLPDETGYVAPYVDPFPMFPI